MASWWRRLLAPDPPAAPAPLDDGHGLTDPTARARWAWRALAGHALVRRRGAVRIHDALDPRSAVAALWPCSQVLSAALAVDATGDLDGASGSEPGDPLLPALAAALERYRVGDAYATHPGGSQRFVDDDLWVGLAAVRAGERGAPGPPGVAAPDAPAWWWAVAERTARFAAVNQEPDGGVRWLEPRRGQRSPRNACSTAPAIALWLAVAASTGDAALVAAAERADHWLSATLRSPDGLVWDHQEPDGRIERTVWSYNQGMAVAADLARWRHDGQPRHLDRAEATTAAALAHLEDRDRLWRQPPAFVAIFFREVAALDAVRPQPAALAALTAHAERAWHEARDPRTGRFTGGGIGRYDDGGTLDQAATVQLLATQADPRWWALGR